MAALKSKAMKTRALILLVCLVMAHSAQAQTCRRHLSWLDPVCPVGIPTAPAPGTFLYKVCDLRTPYDPSDPTDTTTYSSPTCNGIGLASAFFEQLASAFTIAPVDVKQKLCALNQIFVSPSASSAWGIWELDPLTGPAPKRGNGGTYITIPDSVLRSATSLAAAEMALYASLFDRTDYPPELPLLSSTGTANTKGAGALAILAHELGHILLADTNADGWGGDGETSGGTPRKHPRTDVCERPIKDCFEHKFLENSTGAVRRWDAKRFHDKMRRWVAFDRQGNPENKHNKSNFKKIWQDVKQSHWTDAEQGIQDIYTSGEFVSLFAAVSPEEDFVETYKYKVLAAARDAKTLEGLNLTIAFAAPIGPVEVLDAVRSPAADLGGKILCVNSLVP
jgi:hypothetical protein